MFAVRQHLYLTVDKLVLIAMLFQMYSSTYIICKVVILHDHGTTKEELITHYGSYHGRYFREIVLACVLTRLVYFKAEKSS